MQGDNEGRFLVLLDFRGHIDGIRQIFIGVLEMIGPRLCARVLREAFAAAFTAGFRGGRSLRLGRIRDVQC